MSTVLSNTTRMESPPRLRMTEAEYDAWHDEELTGEWVDGEVELMSPVSTRQMTLQIWLTKVLGMYIDLHQLGLLCGPEYTIRMSKARRRRMPDLFFLQAARTSILTATLCDGPPDAALEIVAPESTVRDYRVKYQEYQAFGIREYWIIDPQAEIVQASLLDTNGVYQPIPNIDGRIDSTVIPGWFLKPEWLWTDPPRSSIEVLRELNVRIE